MRRLLFSLCLGLSLTCSVSAQTQKAEHHSSIKWNDWSDAAFQKARSENKPLVLDLEAVWCHWCHVMDERTYANETVEDLINNKMVGLRVDQDNRPDISVKYQDYGWPATILFSPSGKEIIKRAGYIPPEEMISILKSVIKQPNKVRPGAAEQKKVTYSMDSALPEPLKQELLQKCLGGYDTKNGGWGEGHKFLDWDTVEYCISRARRGDAKYADMSRATLAGELMLMDPIWGGVYQYSTHGDWVHPHYERIMQMQAENMRIFALAYSAWNEDKYLQGAKEIQRFLANYLTSDDGAFYTSMDADLVRGEHSEEYFKLNDSERKRKGVPIVDKHVYSRENGWAINGLVALYSATGDSIFLNQALKAANWIIANRSVAGGGFSHDAKDHGGPFLEDLLSMGRCFLSLYGATGDRHWLKRAEQSADFIDKQFKLVHAGGKTAGYASASVRDNSSDDLKPNVDQNVMLARFANLLFQYSGRKEDKNIAEIAMRFLATPSVGRSVGMYTGGILLIDDELVKSPAHITVVGAKGDASAKALFQEALKYPSGFRVVEWWDRKEGPLPHMEVDFPELPKAAAFGCANERCSAPVYTPAALKSTVDSLR